MSTIFEKVINMSLIGCYSIFVVMVVRLIMSKCERKYIYYLWFVVFLNLCIPFSFKGAYSIIPNYLADFSITDTGNETVQQEALPMSDNSAITQTPQNTSVSTKQADVNGKNLVLNIAAVIWITGMMVILTLNIAGVFKLRKRISKDKWVCFDNDNRIAQVRGLDTPFLWGLWKPTIYLPDDTEDEMREYIIAHEQCHMERRDYLLKILAFLITSIHWFNPLVWIAYRFFCIDMEISCDEAVLIHFDGKIKKQYAESLLKYAASQNGYILSPTTFGEPVVKSRIKKVLGFKKSTVTITAIPIACVAVIAAGLLLRPNRNVRIEQDFALSEEKQEFLQNMCFYMPSFASHDEIDESFIRNLIFYSFTSIPMTPEGEPNPIYGEGEQMQLYREDLGFSEDVFRISEKDVHNYVRLLFGIDMPEFRPAFEDMAPGAAALYYQDGYYYIGASDFGEIQYQYNNVEVRQDDKGSYAVVYYDKLAVNDEGDWESMGTVTFYLQGADNDNGFIIMAKNEDSEYLYFFF